MFGQLPLTKRSQLGNLPGDVCVILRVYAILFSSEHNSFCVGSTAIVVILKLQILSLS